MNPQYIVIIAVAVFMGWFALGMLYNLRRGDKMLKWMQVGLPLIGPHTTFHWLGTSVAEMTVTNARRPFKRLDTLLVFKPRDVFWMTILAFFQGRNDTLIFRAYLNSSPRLDLELADPKAWTGRTALQQVSARGWESTDYHDMRLMAPKGLINLAAKTLDQLAVPMQSLSPRYARFSLRKTAPNLEIHLPFPDPLTTDAKAFFQSLNELGRAVVE